MKADPCVGVQEGMMFLSSVMKRSCLAKLGRLPNGITRLGDAGYRMLRKILFYAER
jgi:hypothetical protein